MYQSQIWNRIVCDCIKCIKICNDVYQWWLQKNDENQLNRKK